MMWVVPILFVFLGTSCYQRDAVADIDTVNQIRREFEESYNIGYLEDVRIIRDRKTGESKIPDNRVR